MGIAVMGVPVARKLGTHIFHSAEQNKALIQQNEHPTAEEEAFRNLDETNAVVLATTAEWYEFLELLEQKPENYVKMCPNGDVERTIKGLEQYGRTVRKPNWIRLGEDAKRNYPDLYKRFKIVDDNLKAFEALIREVSWSLSILHKADSLDETQFILVG
ncbi:MAG: hypothetical protein OXH06_06555 [Gemmatimonadetes bacterium]|nr:hypothetical protein [Gemmatimonadota bacterium]